MKWKSKIGVLIFVWAAVTICFMTFSCQLEQVDVSTNMLYSPIMGKKIKLKEDVWALGISSATPPHAPADYIVLVPGVGFSGREVVSRDRLKKGTVVEVVNVFASEFLKQKIDPKCLVKEIGSNHLNGVRTQIDLKNKISDDNYGLDPNAFEIVR